LTWYGVGGSLVVSSLWVASGASLWVASGDDPRFEAQGRGSWWRADY